MVQVSEPGTGSALAWTDLDAGNGYYVIGTNSTTGCASETGLKESFLWKVRDVNKGAEFLICTVCFGLKYDFILPNAWLARVESCIDVCF